MPERINHKIEHKESPMPHPSLLDVVMVDGRWAQVVPGSDSIAFLDEKVGKKYSVAHEINWDDYDFIPLDERFVGDLVDNSKMTDVEYSKIAWGSEQDEHPELKECVTVFGEYKKK